MTRHRLMIAAASAAILLGTAGLGANALEAKAGVGGINANVSVGGGNTAQAKASVGNTANATATVGGGGGNVASTKATTGNNTVTASIGTGGGGSLVDSNTAGSPLGGGLTSGTSINLGSLFGVGGGGGGTGGGGTGGGGGGTGGGGGGKGGGGGGVIVPDTVQAAIGDMSSGEIAAMKRQCGSILAMPMAYDASLIDLCKVLRRL